MTYLSVQSKKCRSYSLVSKAKPPGMFINTRLPAWRNTPEGEKKTTGTFVTQEGTGSRGRAKNRAQRSQQDDGPSGEEPGPVPNWNQFPQGSGEWEVSGW